MDFKITILGTGAAIPTLRRGNSAQFIQCHQRQILIDCGEGTQLQMRKFGLKFQNVQIILISHLHGDHIFGLPGLIGTMQLLGRNSPLLIIGPKGLKSFLLSLFEIIGLPVVMPIEFKELETKKEVITVFSDKSIEIKAFPLHHRIATFGYRINEKTGKRGLDKEAFDKTGVSIAYIDKLKNGEDIIDNNGVHVRYEDVTFPPKPTISYAYCSDTAYYPTIVEHIQGVDLLYHEATFAEKERSRAEVTYHSTASDAAKIAQEAKVGKLILGHLSARYNTDSKHLEEARIHFNNTVVAKDGDIFNL
ncbi:MAG: ribonuclease Z [Brumimicrobium sp.]|nr:ribonuclease Z [Brumimicrobium sp.]MCO5268796.1 ribonuclease Z [Brumimicrobium sp.]